jgi:hypothetical protein
MGADKEVRASARGEAATKINNKGGDKQRGGDKYGHGVSSEFKTKGDVDT